MAKKQQQPQPMAQEFDDSGIEFADLGTGEDPYKILKDLFNEKGLEFKTDLTIAEIRSIAKILFLAEYVELPVFKNFIFNVLKLKVSKDRKGRLEFINAFKSQHEEQLRMSMMNGGQTMDKVLR